MIVWGETGRCRQFRFSYARGAVGEAGLDIRCGAVLTDTKTIAIAGDEYYFAYLLDILELRYGAASRLALDG